MAASSQPVGTIVRVYNGGKHALMLARTGAQGTVTATSAALNVRGWSVVGAVCFVDLGSATDVQITGLDWTGDFDGQSEDASIQQDGDTVSGSGASTLSGAITANVAIPLSPSNAANTRVLLPHRLVKLRTIATGAGATDFTVYLILEKIHI